MLVGNGGCHDMMEVVRVGHEGSRRVVVEAEMCGGDMGCVGEGPGCADGAVELGASCLYIGVGRGCVAGGVRVWEKQVGSGGLSKRGEVAQGHGCGACGGEG